MGIQSTFWDFSIEFYSEPSVSRVCIELQDALGVDVNVLLFVLWCSNKRRKLSEQELTQVAVSAHDWQSNVVKPLRGVRRFLKQCYAVSEPAATGDLREAIKKLELEAERMQQSALSSEFSDVGTAVAEVDVALDLNISLYQNFLHAKFTTSQVAVLAGRLDFICRGGEGP